jgi:dihydrofolate reductase
MDSSQKNGSIDWLNEIPNPDGSDYGFSDFMYNIDSNVMGKNTFELVLTFDQWPYKKPVFVLSRTLQKVSAGLVGKVEIINGNPDTVVSLLNSRNYKNLYIDGGITIPSEDAP